MHVYPKRLSLQGLESEIFKLVSYSATPAQWADWLRVPLEHAAARGNLDLFNALLGAGANGRAAGWRGCRGRTLIDAAAVGGSVDVMSALLQAGAQQEVNVVSVSSGRSALYAATVCGHERAARKLVLVGADASFVDPVDKCSVLHSAVRGGHEELANYLLMSGAPVNSQDNQCASPLHVAASEGYTGVVSTLLQKGAEKDALDKREESPLVKASRNGHLAVVKALMAAGADINIRSTKRTDGINVGSALDWAARKGHVGILKAIVGRGADVNSAGADGVTALHHAAFCGQADVIHELIAAGADVDHMDCLGRTPLLRACARGAIKAVATLLRRGAAFNTTIAGCRTTVLHAVCLCIQLKTKVDQEATVDLLLRWGADETALDDEGRAPDQLLNPPGISSGFPANERASIEDGCRRARILLARAPVDRAWRRRCWLVMLRSRVSTDRNGRSDGGGIGVIGSSDGSSRERSCKAGKRDSGGGVSGDTPSGNNGVTGESAPGGGDWGFGNVVALVVGLEPEGVFRNIVGFL